MKLTTNKQRKASQNVLCFIVISVINLELISVFRRSVSEFCAPLWDFTQCPTVVPYRRFGTTYRPIFIKATCHVNSIWWMYVHVETSCRLMPSVRRRVISVKVRYTFKLPDDYCCLSDAERVRWKYVHFETSWDLVPFVWRRVGLVKVCTCGDFMTICAICYTLPVTTLFVSE